MDFKGTQSNFEDDLKAKLEMNAFIKQVEAAAGAFLKARYSGIQSFCQPGVAKDIVERYRDREQALRCMGYLLQQVVDSGAISTVYTPAQATCDTWNMLKAALDAGTTFEFTQKPNPEFRSHLRIAASNQN